MSAVIIRGANIINRGESKVADVFIKNDRIEKIDTVVNYQGAYHEVSAEGLWMLPGIIDDQVHFREPGLTHKACIETESKAAIAGGVTTFMEMPNTKPSALTQTLLLSAAVLLTQRQPLAEIRFTNSQQEQER